MCNFNTLGQQYKAVKFHVYGNPYSKVIIDETNTKIDLNTPDDKFAEEKKQLSTNIRASLGMNKNVKVLFGDDEKLILRVKFFMQRPFDHFIAGKLKPEHKSKLVNAPGDVNNYLSFLREAMIDTLFNSDSCIIHIESLMLFSNEHSGSTQVLLVKATEKIIESLGRKMDILG